MKKIIQIITVGSTIGLFTSCSVGMQNNGALSDEQGAAYGAQVQTTPATPQVQEPQIAPAARSWKDWEKSQFRSADQDKNGGVTHAELISFHQLENAKRGTKNDPKITATWWMAVKDLDGDERLSMAEFHFWKAKKK
jgi:hypothetical protein